MRRIPGVVEMGAPVMSTTWAMLAISAVVLAGATVSVGSLQSVSEPALGAEWQCSRTAFFITTCVRVQQHDATNLNQVRFCRQSPGGGSKDQPPNS